MCAHQNRLYLSTFKYKLGMHDDQFFFSSFWLPGPRFELRTLAGYRGLGVYAFHISGMEFDVFKTSLLIFAHLFSYS
jgi:hypothetical protein